MACYTWEQFSFIYEQDDNISFDVTKLKSFEKIQNVFQKTLESQQFQIENQNDLPISPEHVFSYDLLRLYQKVTKEKNINKILQNMVNSSNISIKNIYRGNLLF